MSTAYLVNTPFSDANSWASFSGGVGGSFGGIPDDTVDAVVDTNSPSADCDIESLIKSITITSGYTNAITQITNIEVNEFSQDGGVFDTDGFDFVCNESFTGSGGQFIGVGSILLMPVNFVFSGVAFSGSPAQATVDTSTDLEPSTIEDAISENAKNPKRVKGDEGEVEMHSIDDQIKAAKFVGANKQFKVGIQGFLTKIKPSGTV